MFSALLKLGAISGAVKDIEQTETGQFVLGTAKVIIITVLIIITITSILIVRKVNNTFSATNKDINVLKSQMLGMNRQINYIQEDEN